MPYFARLLYVALLLGLAAFFVFGLLATYEPTNRNIWPWRIGYGVLIVASLLVAGFLAFRKGKHL